MTIRVGVALAVVLAVGVATGVAVATSGSTDDRALQFATPSAQPTTEGPDGETIIVRSDGNIDDQYRPDRTAGEWATYADHVVVATIVADEDARHIFEKDGRGWYDRRVTLKVDDVLWSNDHAKKAAPTTFTHPAWGYFFTDNDPAKRTKWAIVDRPRVELGHRYIVAFAWEPARCPRADALEQGRWRYLGADSVIPYDGPVIGTGEMSGGHQDAEQARAAVDPRNPNLSLEDEMLGRTPSDLRTALARATPVPAERFTSGTSCVRAPKKPKG